MTKREPSLAFLLGMLFVLAELGMGMGMAMAGPGALERYGPLGHAVAGGWGRLLAILLGSVAMVVVWAALFAGVVLFVRWLVGMIEPRADSDEDRQISLSED
jgi:hypothetical protein